MTTTRPEASVVRDRKVGGRSLRALLDEFERRLGMSFEVRLFAEHELGHLSLRERGDAGSAEETYLMLRAAEHNLGNLIARRAMVLPGQEASVVAVTVNDESLIGVIIGRTEHDPSEDDLRDIADNADAMGASFVHALESVHAADHRTEAEGLLDISRALGDSSQLPKLIPVIARASAVATGFDRATVLLWRGNGVMAAGASQLAGGAPDIRLWGAFRAIEHPLPAVLAVLDSAEPHYFEHAETAPDLEPDRWVKPFGIRSVLVVPLVDRSERHGVLILDSVSRLRVTRRQVATAQRIAEQGAVAISIAQMIQRERGTRQRAQLVLGTVVQAATQMNTSGVLTVIAEGINAVVDDATTVAFVLEDGRAAKLAVCGKGEGAVDLIDGLTDPSNYRKVENPFTQRHGGLTQLTQGLGPQLLADLGVGRVLVVPVRRASRDLGWVVSFDRRSDPYLDDDLRVISGIAAQAALSLHTANLLEGERATVARLEDLDRLKNAFVAAVSHELRTPLTAIVGFADILSEQVEDAMLNGFIEDMRREASVLEALIGNLLDTSRLEAGMLQLNLASTDILGVLEEAIQVVTHGFSDRDIRVFAGPSVESIVADRVRLRQVFVNLIENAAKYSPPGSPIDVIVDEPTRDGLPRLRIAVEDHGSGIPPQHRALVFERFHRLSAHKAKPGTGIGLYLVKALVEAHGGTIEVEDKPDGTAGARFSVELPVPPPPERPDGTTTGA